MFFGIRRHSASAMIEDIRAVGGREHTYVIPSGEMYSVWLPKDEARGKLFETLGSAERWAQKQTPAEAGQFGARVLVLDRNPLEEDGEPQVSRIHHGKKK